MPRAIGERPAPAVRLRPVLPPAVAIGPGEGDRARAMAETGSIAAASRGLGASSERAGHRVEPLDRSSTEPSLWASRGGAVLDRRDRAAHTGSRRIEVANERAAAEGPRRRGERPAAALRPIRPAGRQVDGDGRAS